MFTAVFDKASNSLYLNDSFSTLTDLFTTNLWPFCVFQGKSTLACTLGRELHCRGKLAYVLDGDNLRHGLNKDLGFKAEDRAENIRRVGKYILLFSVKKAFTKSHYCCLLQDSFH